MPAKFFRCPDGAQIDIQRCLSEGGCRMKVRCASRQYLKLVSSERVWTGKPSCTQLIGGTMLAYLRLTTEYTISPDDRAFMILGTMGHNALSNGEDEYSLIEEKMDGPDTKVTGIFDIYEVEDGKGILIDYKTSGSYKVAKALGFHVVTEETGVVFKSGKRKGQPKTRKILRREDSAIDRWEWTLQLNHYRMELEKRGFKVDEMRIQVIVRDGGTWMARSRAVFRKLYNFRIERINDEKVTRYFDHKRKNLEKALADGWEKPCSVLENWEGIRCERYCEVAQFCSYGKYRLNERSKNIMPIKGLTDIRRFPLLGSIRLGIKKLSEKGIEYPSEVDYFICDPRTPDPVENQRLKDLFTRLYGEKPKRIKIMFPHPDLERVFPQWWKRYGSSTMLQCKGDGEVATCMSEEFTKDLEVTGKQDGMIQVKCAGKECPYVKARKCNHVGVLNILLPDLPGAGVWRITTTSWNSMVNVNSGIAWLDAASPRHDMIPVILERIPTDVMHKGSKSTHYCLNVDMEYTLKELQQWGQIEASAVLLELPAADDTADDILYQQTPQEAITDGKTILPPEVEKPEDKSEPAQDVIKQLAEKMDAGVVDLLRYADQKYATTAQAEGYMRSALNVDRMFTAFQKEFDVWYAKYLETVEPEAEIEPEEVIPPDAYEGEVKDNPEFDLSFVDEDVTETEAVVLISDDQRKVIGEYEALDLPVLQELGSEIVHSIDDLTYEQAEKVIEYLKNASD